MATWQDEIDRLSEENRRLKAKLKQQYKRAKLAEEACDIHFENLHTARRDLEAAKSAHTHTEQIGRRLFVMLEHALQLANNK